MAKGGKPETLGEVNRMLILNCLRERGNMSKADLARELGMSFPAVSSNVKTLQENGYIYEVGEGDNPLGRKSLLLSFNAKAGYVIGVDLGRFWIRVMLSDLAGEVLASVKKETVATQEFSVLEDEIVQLLYEVLKESGKLKKDILYIGIGIPGVLYDNKILLAPYSPNMPLTEFKKRIEDDFQAQVVIDNSVNLGALGEQWKGAGRGHRDFALINYGVGIGGALVLDGKLHRGFHNAAGEIGYMVSDPLKLRKRFDEIGVLENIISKEKIQRHISHDNFREEVELLIERYKDGEPYICSMLDEIFVNIGIMLINLSACLDLEIIIISGGLGIGFGQLFLEKWQEMLEEHVPFPPKIVLSEMDNKEGVLGAIYNGIEKIHHPNIAD